MPLNTGDQIHVYAVSPSKDIIDWEEEITNEARKRGIEYDGPVKPPHETINGRFFRKRIFRFPSSDRAQDLLTIKGSDQVYIEISIGTTLDLNVEDIVPDDEIPASDHEADITDTGTVDTDQNETKTPADVTESEPSGPQQTATNGETGSSSEAAADLECLQERAKEDAVESVPESKVNVRQSTQEYTRSSEVRKYVMERAGGACEGCGEPAPFTSTTGEPYLHAHHIHELSDGGSDTPMTVIALCPNCHYRVHHGIEGEEYNRELMDRLAEIEDVPVDEITEPS